MYRLHLSFWLWAIYAQKANDQDITFGFWNLYLVATL
jgi:hypothetical protein